MCMTFILRNTLLIYVMVDDIQQSGSRFLLISTFQTPPFPFIGIPSFKYAVCITSV